MVDNLGDIFIVFSESCQDIVEIMIANAILHLNLFLKILYHHSTRCLLHILEYFSYVVVMGSFSSISIVVVCIVKVNQSKFVAWFVLFYKLHLLFMSALDAFCIHIGTRSAFKAIGVHLHC